MILQVLKQRYLRLIITLLFLGFFCTSTHIKAKAREPRENGIRVDSNLVANAIITTPIKANAYKDLQTSQNENFWFVTDTVIAKEITSIKSISNKTISKGEKYALITEQNAPTISAILYALANKLAKKANLACPKLYLWDEKASTGYGMYGYRYNSQENRIIFKPQTIALFLCNQELLPYIESLMAHEFGHIIHNHYTSSPQNELLADKAAITLLENPKKLAPAILGHWTADWLFSYVKIYTSLSPEQSHQAVHNALGYCFTLFNDDWKTFAQIPTLAMFDYCMKYSTTGISFQQSTQKVTNILYENLEYIRSNKTILSTFAKDLSFKTFENAYAQVKTHPAPLERCRPLI